MFRKASAQKETQTFKSQGRCVMGKLVPLSYNARNKICALKEKKKKRILFRHVVLGKGLPLWPGLRAQATPWPLQTLE